MQRRTLLSALGVGAASAAGCAAPLTGSDPDETTQPTARSGETTADGGDTPPTTADDGAWESRVVDLETGPRTLSAMVGSGAYPNVSVDGEFVETATPDHPARLQVTVRNDAEYEQVVELDTLHFLSGLPLRGTPEEDDSRSGLRFPPVADHRLASEVPDVERGESGYWRVASTDHYWHPDRVTLAGEETVAGEFWVVGGDSSDGFPTGQYGREDAPRIVAWNTDSPGPTGESRFADADVPDLPTGETEWYHDAGPETGVYLQPERERATPPAGLEFTLHRRSRRPTRCGLWDLWKLHEGSWHYVAPHGYWELVCLGVVPGATDTRRLIVTNESPIDMGSEELLDTNQPVGFLGGGQYAYEAGYRPEEGEGTHAALFEIDAPAVTVAARDDTTVERDGDTVTVTTPEWSDESERAELVVTRADDAGEVILAEQVMRDPREPGSPWALRDALAVFDADAERVVVRAGERGAEDAVGREESSRRFEFRDETYEATIRHDV